MAVFEFHAASDEDRHYLRSRMTLDNLDLDRKVMRVTLEADAEIAEQFEEVLKEFKEVLSRHTGSGSQALTLDVDGQIYDLIVEPHPIRATYSPLSMRLRYTIFASIIV